MSVSVPRGPGPDSDEGVRACFAALEQLAADCSGADVELYRYGRHSIRVRVVWDGFGEMNRSQRRKLLWMYLEPLPDAILSDVAFTITATSGERADGARSEEFDNPTPLPAPAPAPALT